MHTDVFAIRIGRNRNGDADFETFLDPAYVISSTLDVFSAK